MFLNKPLSFVRKSAEFGLISAAFANNVSKYLLQSVQKCFAVTSAATPASGAQPIGQRRFRLPVETDPHKLVNYCCGANYFIDGQEIKLKPDEEYPDWIWSLRLNYPPPLNELDPNTKEFYERLEVVGRQQMWKQRRVARQRFKIVCEQRIKSEQLRWRRRFRALAYKDFDAGYDILEHTEREDPWNLDKKDRFREPEEKEPFYPGIDSVDIPFQVSYGRLRYRPTKRCGHFGW